MNYVHGVLGKGRTVRTQWETQMACSGCCLYICQGLGSCYSSCAAISLQTFGINKVGSKSKQARAESLHCKCQPFSKNQLCVWIISFHCHFQLRCIVARLYRISLGSDRPKLSICTRSWLEKDAPAFSGDFVKNSNVSSIDWDLKVLSYRQSALTCTSNKRFQINHLFVTFWIY